MTHADIGGAMIDAPTLDILRREKNNSLSPREWKFRLAGYGYAIKDVAGKQVVTKLPQGIELGFLPTQFH
ncbi:hypothetical protein NBRC116594_20540 [Shimia sp. NS0008-38b]|uniref:hypothetical protein n=1 Tax=Shimia sp. NS0008-38b TaxID=3127653 RepID=UPI00310A169D